MKKEDEDNNTVYRYSDIKKALDNYDKATALSDKCNVIIKAYKNTQNIDATDERSPMRLLSTINIKVKQMTDSVR